MLFSGMTWRKVQSTERHSNGSIFGVPSGTTARTSTCFTTPPNTSTTQVKLYISPEAHKSWTLEEDENCHRGRTDPERVDAYCFRCLAVGVQLGKHSFAPDSEETTGGRLIGNRDRGLDGVSPVHALQFGQHRHVCITSIAGQKHGGKTKLG